jgi:hypothetical protein
MPVRKTRPRPISVQDEQTSLKKKMSDDLNQKDLTSAGIAFLGSASPDVLVYMPDGCLTLAVNAKHAQQFRIQAPLASLDDFKSLVLNTQEQAPAQARSHCEQINAIEVLTTNHCVVELLYRDLVSTLNTGTDLEFIRGKSENGTRTYTAWFVTARLVIPDRPHVFWLRLTPTPAVTLDVTVGECTGSCKRTTHVQVYREHIKWLDYPQYVITPENAPEYFAMDETLQRAEELCTNDASSALNFIKATAAKYDAPSEYTRRIFLETLCYDNPGQEELSKRLRDARQRVFDPAPVIDHVRVDLLTHLKAEQSTTLLKESEYPTDIKTGGVRMKKESLRDQYWEPETPEYERLHEERGQQEQEATQYRIMLLETPTRALVAQLALHGPQTLEDLARGLTHEPLDRLLNYHLVDEKAGKYYLTPTASRILQTAWGQAMLQGATSVGSSRP